MKPPLTPLPWDLFVIFSVTTVSFGVSVYKMAYTGPSAFAVGSAQREVASVDIKPGLVDLGCVERKLSAQMDSFHQAVQLKGRFCNLSQGNLTSFGGVQVRNLTTKAEGEVRWDPTQASFVSEGLQLRPGKNLIQVEWRESATAPFRSYLAEISQR